VRLSVWSEVQIEGSVHKGSISRNPNFSETSFCVLQVLLRNFTNTLWQLYIDFYNIRMVFESSFQLCTFKVADLKKLAILAKMCR